ncbi:carboxylesterase family protein [Streptomyces tricolor]|nr:carboxylesterase family protein [Streptomyces tricolor]
MLVWLHGGALTRGSSAVPVYDGSTFARDGVVCVSVNYRLGVEGYGLFPDAPRTPACATSSPPCAGCYETIEAFGGDPGRITLCGQSAGAISAGALLAAPADAGPDPAGGVAERPARGLRPRQGTADGAPDGRPAQDPRHRRGVRRRRPRPAATHPGRGGPAQQPGAGRARVRHRGGRRPRAPATR